MKDDGDTAAFDVNFYEIAFSSLIIFTTTLPQKKKTEKLPNKGFCCCCCWTFDLFADNSMYGNKWWEKKPKLRFA